MKNLTDKIITSSFEDLDNILNTIPLNKDVGLIVILNNEKYEFLINIKSSNDKLICLGPSGLPDMEHIKKFKNAPCFTRHSWDFNESTIYYNDNTRYVWEGGIGSGWGMGLPNDYFLENIKRILLKITHFFDIKNEDILFYGSSMGGFTSIQLATMIKHSYAIAENPQIDARCWMKSFYIKRGLYSELYDAKTLEKFEKYTYNVIEMMKKENYIPNLTIIHDINHEDINNHLIPFIRELKNLPFKKDDFNKIHIIIEPTLKHEPIPKDKFYDVYESHKCFKLKTSQNQQDYNMIHNGIKTIKKLNLFDEKYYTENNPEIHDLDPLTHYIFIGWKEGRNPSKEFDNDYYLNKYISVRKAKINPLIHYAIWGMEENRTTTPVEEIQPLVKLIEESGLFNEEYYKKNYDNFEQLKPIEHYLLKGWKEGNNPSPKFDNDFYLERYPSIKKSRVNPLVHYIKYGINENREIREVK